MLSGETMPDPLSLEKLANVLNLSLTELLVKAGVVSDRRRLGPVQAQPPLPASISVEQAARDLGIRNPDRIKIFKAMVETLRAQEGEGV